MPPRKRAAAKPAFTKADLTNKRKIQGIAELFGLDPEKLMEQGRDAAPRFQETNRKAQLEAEAVLLFIELRGKNFSKKPCKWCNQDFLYTTTFVAYCSDECRYMKMKDEGIPWNPDAKSDVERWDNRMPLVIGAYATERVMEWLEKNPEQLEFPAEFHPREVAKSADQKLEDEADEIMRLYGVIE